MIFLHFWVTSKIASFSSFHTFYDRSFQWYFIKQSLERLFGKLNCPIAWWFHGLFMCGIESLNPRKTWQNLLLAKQFKLTENDVIFGYNACLYRLSQPPPQAALFVLPFLTPGFLWQFTQRGRGKISSRKEEELPAKFERVGPRPVPKINGPCNVRLPQQWSFCSFGSTRVV